MNSNRLGAACATIALTTLGSVATATPAHADETSVPGTAGATSVSGAPEAPRPAFYEPPAEIPAKPGTVIRQEPGDTILDPLHLSDKNYDSRRVMYSSLDREDKPYAVTGIAISPKKPWVGAGRRPVIGFSAGTQGLADKCAPSRQVRDFTEYELIYVGGLLARGYTVVMTDYQGLGTPGSHTYMNREVQARAVLDSVRATERLGMADTDANSPVGISGYSQGGGGSAAAGELAPTYAPDLKIKGVAAGAVPADLSAVAAKLDGGPNTGLELYATVGIMAGYHIKPSGILNAAGMEKVRAAEGTCTLELGPFGKLKTGTLTTDGKDLTSWMAREPLKTALADNKIGNRKPTAPVMVSHSTLDDIIPFAVGKQLVKDWCDKGANVQFHQHVLPGHGPSSMPYATDALAFFEARFAGKPQTSGCKNY